ncbi:hypothetical protein [Microbacterium foliorum]|nr:hypothetical protein [Microbacterium foliorum]
MTDTPDDAMFMAKIRSSLSNQNTDSARAQIEHAPKQWTAAEEAELARRLHGDAEARIAKLIEDANNGRI